MASLATNPWYLVYALVTLGLGLIVAYLTKRVLGVRHPGWLVGSVLLPGGIVAVYLGLLAEVKLGPFEAKIKEFAISRVRPDKIRPTEAKALGEFREKYEARAYLGMASPLVFFTLAGEKASINKVEMKGTTTEFANIAVCIQQALHDNSFLALVLVDSEDRVLGYFLRDMFIDLLKFTFLSSPLPEDQFYRNVNKARDDFLRTNTELWLIIQHPRPRLEAKGRYLTLRREATNAEAYRLMIEEGQDVVPVVDNEHRYAGVMTRRQIEGEFFLKVLENPS